MLSACIVSKKAKFLYPQFQLCALNQYNISLSNFYNDFQEFVFAQSQQYYELAFIDTDLHKEDLQAFFNYQQQENQVKLILMSHNSEMAIQAVRNKAFDYLLLPIKPKQLEKTLARLTTTTPLRPRRSPEKTLSRLAIPNEDGILMQDITEIIYVQADRNYTHVYTLNSKITSSKPLAEYIKLLPEGQFFQVNRSFVVNIHHIESYKNTSNGVLRLSNGFEVDIPRRKRREVLELLGKSIYI